MLSKSTRKNKIKSKVKSKIENTYLVISFT